MTNSHEGLTGSLERAIEAIPYDQRVAEVEEVIATAPIELFQVESGIKIVEATAWAPEREIVVPKRVKGIILVEDLPCPVEADHTGGLAREIDYLRGGGEKVYTQWNVHRPYSSEETFLDQAGQLYILNVLGIEPSSDINNFFQEVMQARESDYSGLWARWDTDRLMSNKYSAAMQIICDRLVGSKQLE